MVPTGVVVDARGAAELTRHHDERRGQQAALLKIADERGIRLVERRQCFVDVVADLLVHVPAAVGERNEPHACLDEPPRQEHPLAGGIAAILVADRIGLRLDVESAACLLGTHQRIGPLVKGVHGREVFRTLESLKVAAHGIPQPLAGREPIGIDPVGQRQIADREVGVGGIRADREGTVCAAQIAGSGVGRRQVGNAHVGWEICPRSIFMGDHAAKAREGERRTRPVAGEHVVGATFMGRLAMRHRSHDGDLVSDLGRLAEQFVELDARKFRVDRLHVAAVFGRRERLGVECLLLRPPTRQPYVDDALRLPLEVGERLRVGQGRSAPQVTTERQAECREGTDVEKIASAVQSAAVPRSIARHTRHGYGLPR